MATDTRVVRIPSPLLEQGRKLKQVEALQRATSPGEPSASDLIKQLGFDSESTDGLRRSLSSEVSTQVFVGDTDSLTVEETLFSEEDDELLEPFDQRALRRCFREIFSTLATQDQYVLDARFGLGGNAPRTLVDVGQELGVSRERVHQIERKALAHLQKNDQGQSIASEVGAF